MLLLRMLAACNDDMNAAWLDSESTREMALTNPEAAIRNWINYKAFIERRPDPLRHDRPPDYRPPAPPHDPPPPPRHLHPPPPYADDPDYLHGPPPYSINYAAPSVQK